MKKRPFVPGFLKKIDRNMLLHNPDCWSSRLHLVVYFSLLLISILSVLSFFAFNEARVTTGVVSWTSFTGLVCFIGLVIWMIYLLRFNVFKRYGVQKKQEGFISFIRYFICVFFIVLPTYIPLLVESFRANRAFSSNELVEDVNNMNKNILELNRSIMPFKWQADTLKLVPDDHPKLQSYYGADNTVMEGEEITIKATNEIINDHYMYVGSKELQRQIISSDSMLKIDDSLYLRYRVPDFAIFYAHDAALHADKNLLSSFELYNAYLKHEGPQNFKQWEDELNRLLKKYDVAENIRTYISYNEYNFQSKLQRIYPIESVRLSLFEIEQKKYRWDFTNAGLYVRVIYYITLVLSLLVFIFRHSTVRNFFWTVLSFIVLLILNAIVLAFLNVHEFYVAALVIAYYIIFCIIAFNTWQSTYRSTLHGVALNLFTFGTPFIPFLGLLAYSSYKQMLFESTLDNPYYINDYSSFYTHMEVIGLLLFLILLLLVIKKLYRRWYALPST